VECPHTFRAWTYERLKNEPLDLEGLLFSALTQLDLEVAPHIFGWAEVLITSKREYSSIGTNCIQTLISWNGTGLRITLMTDFI